MASPNTNSSSNPARRLRLIYGLLIVVVGIFGVRLFYLQVIRYNHYKVAALQQQEADYSIPAARGLIEAHDGSSVEPLVLNQTLYTLYCDPKFITSPASEASFVAKIIGGNVADYEHAMRMPNRYDILANKLPENQKKAILAAKKPGLNVEAHTYRVYPEGDLAAQVLGFVNNSGQGTYGIEQVLNSDLSGKAGRVKAITDVNGVPLPASGKNVDIQPQPGKNVALTLNIPMQRQVEQALEKGLKQAHSSAGSAIVMDVHTGAVVAMANYPTYNPSDYANVTDTSVFDNRAVSSQLEVGSIMKVLTTTAALDQGTINEDTTYPDNGKATVDGFTITNVEPIPGGVASIQEILTLSLNTGAVHMLKTLGGGDINSQARHIWYDYLVNHYGFGKPTGIEQSYEASGLVPNPDRGSALNLHYAETTFGQGISVTMIQMAAALSAVLNGGTYYQPHLVDGFVNADGSVQKRPPKIVRTGIVKPTTPPKIEQLMEGVFTNNHTLYQSHTHAGYIIGGKTGTAQIPINGGYDPNNYNGTFLGFVGGDQPQYVIDVLTKSPQLLGYEYAGTQGAAPIFGSIEDALINSGLVTPKSH